MQPVASVDQRAIGWLSPYLTALTTRALDVYDVCPTTFTTHIFVAPVLNPVFGVQRELAQ